MSGDSSNDEPIMRFSQAAKIYAPGCARKALVRTITAYQQQHSRACAQEGFLTAGLVLDL